MVAFNFNLAFYAYDDFNAGARTQGTVSYANGTTVSLDAGATPIVVNITDDDGNPAGSPDNLFSDGFIDTPGDGSAPSTANNDQVLTDPVTVNGDTYAAGSQVELEFAFSVSSGETFWIIRIDGTNVGISGPALPVPGTTYTVSGSSDGAESPLGDVPCFLEGTLIATPSGEVPVEALSVGDLVLTLDHGAQPIRWIAAKKVDAARLAEKPALRPIRIPAGALGPGRPKAPLHVSPQHRILLRSRIARRMFGAEEILLPAVRLLGLAGIEVAADIAPVRYIHFKCDRHEIVRANGAHAETLFVGARAVQALGPAAMGEIADLFGARALAANPLARPVPSGKRAARMLSRHRKNGKELFGA